jgi:phosphatidate cytidylyltransferase
MWTLAGLYLFLITATIAAWIGDPGGEVETRIRSWWGIVGIFTVALLSVGWLETWWVLTVLLAFVSFLALKEYLTIIPTRMADRRVLVWAYLAIPLQYLFISYENYGMFIVLIPVYLLLFLPMAMVMIGETRGFLNAVGTLQWGAMITVFSLGHLAFLVRLPGDVDTGLGLLLYVLLVTELNDVAQFLWGKLLGGRIKIAPKVSPGKSAEGLIGGVLTTTALSIGLGTLLTPMSWWLAAAVGLLLSVAGFVGDLTVSALKRDLKLKDSGDAIPGHGGVLDRVDSLTYAAPLFFHVIRFVYYLPR